MTVSITFTGDAVSVRAEMAALLGTTATFAPAVSEVSSDKPTTTAPAETTKGRGSRKPKDETKLPEGPALNVVAAEPNISTGGERVDPNAKAQDTADETQPAPAPDKVYTVDDVRNAVGVYVNHHGLDAAKEDLMSCFKDATDGKFDRISALTAADPQTVKAIVDAVTAASEAVDKDGKRLRYVAKKA